MERNLEKLEQLRKILEFESNLNIERKNDGNSLIFDDVSLRRLIAEEVRKENSKQYKGIENKIYHGLFDKIEEVGKNVLNIQNYLKMPKD